MKRITALTLILIFILSLLSLTSCGASKGLEFAQNGDGASYSVVGLGGCTDAELVIPNRYEGMPVTAIGASAFKMTSELTSVTIPKNVTVIGEKAFYFCDGITELVFKGGVTTIGPEAFHGCVGLTEIVLPEGVEKIESKAFAYCTGLESLTVPKSLKSFGAEVFVNCKEIKYLTYLGTKEEWRAITLDPTWRQTSLITRVFCSDGTISFD